MLEPWVSWSVLLPSCPPGLSSCKFGTAQCTSHPLTCPGHPPAPCRESSPPWLLISTPLTGLDECFFFNFFVVRVPYSLILWQFWLFFFYFKFVFILLLVVWRGKLYLPMPPSWPEVLIFLINVGFTHQRKKCSS